MKLRLKSADEMRQQALDQGSEHPNALGKAVMETVFRDLVRPEGMEIIEDVSVRTVGPDGGLYTFTVIEVLDD